MPRRLLTPEEFDRLKSRPRKELLAVLGQFVKRSERGRPIGTGEGLTQAEYMRRYRAEKKLRPPR